MKKTLLLLASAIVLLAGCAKEKFADLKGGEMTSVTFTAQMENGVTTRALADNDGKAANVNRCIMEVYYDGELFTRMCAPVTNKQASFTTQLVSNRTYTVAFWADCVVNASSESGLSADNYYNTSEGLGKVALKGTYAGNLDARDAFAFCDDYTVVQGGSAFAATLKRPFAQINVITTDVATVKKVTSAKPETVNVTLKNATTMYNVLDSTAVAGETADLNYEATLYKWDDTKSECTLSMDYIFAEQEKAVIDIDWKAKKANNADVAHSFASVPYQRNYRTNIKGALLTTQGQWTVTVDPIWTNNGTGEYEVIVLVANTIAEAQELINANAGSQSVSKTVEIQVKEQITAEKQLYIPDNTTTPSWVFKINDMTDQGKIVVKDEHPANASVNYKKSAEVSLPTGITAAQTIFNTPNAHGVVSGSFGRIDATTSATTLEVSKSSTVDTIHVHKGNVALYGTVKSIVNEAADSIIVNVYDGANWNNWEAEKGSNLKAIVNLGTYSFDPTGYNVEGSTVKANGGSPATWTVTITDEWKYFAAKEFSNVSGTTITIMNAEELALFSNKINEGVNYSGYTFEFGADINLSAHYWNPIKIIETSNGTNLTIDGKSRKITGLTIDSKENFSGLFGKCFSHGTIIKNIVIENPDVKQTLNQEKAAKEVGLNYTAALIAHLGCGKIDNCSIIGGSISGEEQVGAIVGYIADGRVSNCIVNGTSISGKNRVGGIAGKINTDSWFEVVDNTIKATVTATEKVGGIAGQILGVRTDYKIKNNRIDVALNADSDKNPIATLRRCDNDEAFINALSTNIKDNYWTAQTYDKNSFEYVPGQKIYNDIVVAKIGDTKYYTMADALKAAASGDIIVVQAGTFNAEMVGSLTISEKEAVRYKSLTIKAAEGATPIFTSDLFLGYDDSSTANASMTVTGLKFENASLALSNYVNAYVEGCNFTGTGNQSGALIVMDACCTTHKTSDVYPASSVVVKDCTVNGTATDKPGIRVRNAGNTTITGCTVKDSKHNGILIESNGSIDNTPVKAISITANTITEWNASNIDGGGRAMRLSLGSLATGSTVTVTGNTLTKQTLGLDTPDYLKSTGDKNATFTTDITSNYTTESDTVIIK